MSFEMVMVSDQMRVLVDYNYGEVKLTAGTQDQFGKLVRNNMGYVEKERL